MPGKGAAFRRLANPGSLHLWRLRSAYAQARSGDALSNREYGYGFSGPDHQASTRGLRHAVDLAAIGYCIGMCAIKNGADLSISPERL